MKCLLIVLLLVGGPAFAADPDALWKIVHEKCVPHMLADNDPKPCAEATASSAILKDLVGVAQYLLIPTAKIGGMESPEILRPDAPNYFAAAWDARRFVEAKLGKKLPRDAVSLAINSMIGRSQDQFHIHVDCVRRNVRDALALSRADHWDSMELPGGNMYRVRRIAGADLATTNPLLLLAQERPEAVSVFGQHTLVVVGAKFADGAGFYVLAGRAEPWRLNFGSGEELQDHACAVAH